MADLIDELDALRDAIPPGITDADAMQQWAGMDGAIAFHLIERHADNWNDAGQMMNAWLRANTTDAADGLHSCSWHCYRPGCIKAQRDELRDKVAELESDAARFRWLTEDHADAATRARCRDLLAHMSVMSYSAACADIDAAMNG